MVYVKKIGLLDLVKIKYTEDNNIIKYIEELTSGKDVFEKLLILDNVLIIIEDKKIKGFISVEIFYDNIYMLSDVYINNTLESHIKKEEILIALNATKILYEQSNDTNMTLDLLKLGFQSIDKTIIMCLDLNRKFIEPTMFKSGEMIVLFKKDKDEGLRCILQNEIFKEAGRIPITLDDILFDEKQIYYIDSMCYFLYKDGIAIGYAQVINNYNEHTICNFGILNEYRQCGLGENFLSYVICAAQNKNIKNLFIKVNENNTKAINLYKKVGFIQKGYVENFQLSLTEK